jgi:hypothetical protein
MGEMTSKTAINDLAKLVKAGHRGAVLAEFRERAQAAGVEGRAGGWIYLAGATKPIAQGWQGFADFLLDGLTATARALRDTMAATPAPEAAPARLTFRSAGLTNKEATGGYTAYVAEAEGVKYRIVGNLIAGRMDGARAFRAYRVVGTNGHSLVPAADGRKHARLADAKLAAEADLVEVLRDRAADAEQAPAPACPAGPSCSGAAFPGHPAHYAAEVTFPTPICPDAEAGKPHAAHRIEGTWREQCRGVDAEQAVAAADAGTLLERAVARTGTEGARRLRGRTCCPSSEGDVHDRSCETPEVRESWRPRSERPPVDPHFETVQERDERLAAEAGDRLSMTITPSGMRKIAAHLAARRTGPMPPISELRARRASNVNALRTVAKLLDVPLDELADLPPATDPALEDNVPELVERIERRAKYVALRHMLHVLDGWIEGAQGNHEALGHRGESSPCWNRFDAEDFRRMVNDAARELGVPEPHRPADA